MRPHDKNKVFSRENPSPIVTAKDDWKKESFIEKAKKLFSDRGVTDRCDLSVQKEDGWYVLKGRLDSHHTKARLFRLVPKQGGGRWIIDKLKIGSRKMRREHS